MTPIIWAALLLVLALAFVTLEVFVPSGGVLGFLAGCSLIASLAVVFTGVGLLAASIYLALIAMVVPMLIVALIKWWPYTPIGRRVLNLPPGQEHEITGAVDYSNWKQLVGRVGIAQTTMLPSGMVLIDGRKFDAASDGTVIERGDPVQVIATEGNHIIVTKALSPQPTTETASTDRRTTTEPLLEDPFDL